MTTQRKTARVTARFNLDERLSRFRAAGWAVAAHNDYRLNSESYTFWLFTKGDFCAKGEGRTNEEALVQVENAIKARAPLEARVAELGRECRALNNHLDAAYKAAGLSGFSSRSLASKIADIVANRDRWREAALRYHPRCDHPDLNTDLGSCAALATLVDGESFESYYCDDHRSAHDGPTIRELPDAALIREHGAPRTL